MPTVGKAYVQIIPKTDGNLTGEIEQALGGETIGRNTGMKIAGGIGSALKIGGAAAATLAGATAAITGSVIKGTGAVAEYGDNIDKMSQKMGMSSTAYQEWDAIMQHSGTTIDAMKAPMKTLANAAQSGSEAFSKLGISEEEVKNLSQEDLFSKVITGLQGMEEGTERTALASDLLGRGATELGALLNTSAEDTEAMRQAVHDLGGVMDEDAVKASARFQDQLQDMQTALDGAKRNIMSEFLPSITTVMEGLTDVFSGKDGGDKISKGIEEFSNNLLNAVPKLMEIGAPIVEGIGSAIINNLPMLTDTATQAILTLVSGLVNHLPDIVTAGVQIILTLVSGLSDSLPELIPAMVEAIAQMNVALIQNAPALLEGALQLIIALGQGLLQSLPVLVQQIPQIVSAIGKAIKGAVKVIADAGKSLITGLWNGMKEKTEWLRTKIKNWVGNITDFLKKLFGIGSPSKVMADEIGQWLPAGAAVGVMDNAGSLYDAVDELSQRASNRFNIGATIDGTASRMRVATAGSGVTGTNLTGVRSDISRLEKAIGSMQVVLSSGALVGGIATDMDLALGAKQQLKKRGVVA